jgi:hypothetical protein
VDRGLRRAGSRKAPGSVQRQLASRLSRLTVLFALLTGCDSAPAPTASAPQEAPVVVQAPQFAAPAPPAPPGAAKPMPLATPEADVAREVASSTQTAKGKYEVNIFTQPASAYFTVKDQVVFQVQIPKAMQIYDLTKGRKPTSHDEFMAEIIGRNGIKLPELLPDHRYVYDPKRGELMVEKPM